MPRASMVTESAFQELQRCRSAALTPDITPEFIKTADDGALLALQSTLGCGREWGSFAIPREWMPSAKNCMRRLDLAGSLPRGYDVSSEKANEVWRQILRFAVARMLFPGPNHRLATPSTVVTYLRVLSRWTKRIVTRQIGPGKFWQLLSYGEAGESDGSHGIGVAHSLQFYCKHGFMDDAPSHTNVVRGNAPARDRKGEPVQRGKIQRGKQWQPFPDEYTSQAGWRAVYWIESIGPSLLKALEAAEKATAPDTWPNGRKMGKYRTRSLLLEARNKVISEWNWVDAGGGTLRTLPFELKVGVPRFGGQASWPPQSYAEARGYLGVLQGAHLFPVLLCTGGRDGEVRSMVENSLREVPGNDDRVAFRTFKLSGQVGGRLRDAPVPDLVADAIRQQERLGSYVKSRSGVSNPSLWIQLGVTSKSSPGALLNTLTTSLMTFASAHGLSHLLDDRNPNPHPHRFRKTMARIIALTLVHAPKILMDCFGHRDEEMTIRRYILSDPMIVKEVEQIQRELVILIGVEAIRNADRLEGGASQPLRDKVGRYFKRLGSKATEPQNLYEFAAALTENGTDWGIVAPGILCTSFTKGGLCNRHQGKADPGLCHPLCNSQLVSEEYQLSDGQMASAKAKAFDVIQFSLEQLKTAVEEGNELLIASFAGQVTSWLYRWKDVFTHFERDPLVQSYCLTRQTV